MAVSLPMKGLDQKSLVFSEKGNGKLRSFVGLTHTPHTNDTITPGYKPLLWASTNVRGTLDTNLTHSPTSKDSYLG